MNNISDISLSPDKKNPVGCHRRGKKEEYGLELISDLDYAALLPFRAGPQPIDENNDRLMRLVKEGYLVENEVRTVVKYGGGYVDFEVENYRLSPKGEDALLSYDKMRNEKSKEKAKEAYNHEQAVIDRLKQNKQMIFVGIISTVIGGLILYAFEHFIEIIHFFQSLLPFP